MKRYFDTGVLLKLYTEEPESREVRNFVTGAGEAVFFTSLHHAECVSALRLKCFRRECGKSEAAAAILDVEEDLATGILRRQFVDWDEAWGLCRTLSAVHATATGCRTLDALHVACAIQLGARDFVTGDARQSGLARDAGLQVRSIPAG